MDKANTLFVGQSIIRLDEVDSTNRFALELIAKSNPPEGTVVITRSQTAGRGQIGSHWESEPDKNITLSVILYPGFLLPRKQFLLYVMASLAVYDTLAPFLSTGLRIKWPNDLYFRKNKICGMLLQNTLRGDRILSCVLGIGINVNQIHFRSDAPNPSSLALETSREYDLWVLVNRLCQHLENRYFQLKSGREDHLKKEYVQKLYRLGEQGLFLTSSGEKIQGMISGISPAGKLLISTEEGQRVFDIKEISYR